MLCINRIKHACSITNGLRFAASRPFAISIFKKSSCVSRQIVLPNFYTPYKTNVFGGISIDPSGYKILLILCRELLLQFCFICINTLHIK